jgi:hypothetical protein
MREAIGQAPLSQAEESLELYNKFKKLWDRGFILNGVPFSATRWHARQPLTFSPVPRHQSKRQRSPVIFGEFLVDPASAVVAAPDLAHQQLS